MRILIDTNIILRSTQPANASHSLAIAALTQLSEAGHELCLVPQSVYEYWVVATRPVSVNGLGMPVTDVDRQIQDLLHHFTLLRDERGVYARWYDLVVTNCVQGKLAHDARLVAAMERHGLTNLLTFNKSDFERFSGINVRLPEEVLAGAEPA